MIKVVGTSKYSCDYFSAAFGLSPGRTKVMFSK